jgi:ribose transport system permease protein
MTVETPTGESRPLLSSRLKGLDQAVLVAGLVIVLCVVLSLFVNRFARIENFTAIVSASAGLGVLALAEAIVVIGRGLDLSVIAVYGVTGQVVAQMLSDGHNQLVALGVGLLLAVLLGLVNGVLVTYVELPALFVTLATSLFFIGAARILLFNGVVIFNVPSDAGFVSGIGHASIGPLPISFLLWIAVAAIVALWCRRAVTGRMVYAIGDNTETARITGMPTRPIALMTYVLSAVLAFVGGLILITSTGTFDARTVSAGSQLYDVLAIVVIGGVSLSGGRGSVWGAVAATFLIGVILNGITLMNFNTTQQLLFKSVIVLIALVVDRRLHPQDEETVRPGEL